MKNHQVFGGCETHLLLDVNFKMIDVTFIFLNGPQFIEILRIEKKELIKLSEHFISISLVNHCTQVLLE